MLAIAGDGSPRGSLDDLWSRVAGAMVHPSVAAAARLVDTTTRLQLGPLPEPPRPPGARTSGATWEDEVTVTSRVQATLRDSFGARRPVLRVAAPMGEDTESRPSAGEARPSAAEARPSAGASEARAEGRAAMVEIHGRSTAPAEPKATAAARPAAVQVEIKSPPLSEPQRLFLVHGPSGELLKAVREARGMSLQHVAEATRISVRYLDAIEREDYAALPSAAAFVRGYVREMARLLDLDVERIVEGYMRRFSGDG
jgi:cytoskeletal protein RodZ